MKLIFSIFIFVSVCFHDALACGDGLIVWKKDFKLSWLDFKGNPPDCRVAESALIYVEIKTQGEWKDDLPSYKVYSCFDPQKSWTLDSVCLLLLSHEQLHFDIAELFSRKIRKVVFELRNSGEKDPDIYVNEINRIMNEYVIFGKEYDHQTNHGTLVLAQKEWDILINVELEKYEKNLRKLME